MRLSAIIIGLVSIVIAIEIIVEASAILSGQWKFFVMAATVQVVGLVAIWGQRTIRTMSNEL
jgi:hypothetical protein